jgi:hypothetical protein
VHFFRDTRRPPQFESGMHSSPKKFPSVHLSRAAALALAVPLLALAPAALAQDTPQPAKIEPASTVTPEWEAKFVATLTNATLKGRWAGIKDGQLGSEKEDSYEVVGVTKIEGDKWTINARMSYGGKSLILPIPAQVKWAGDTPVLVIDQLSLGIGPTYSARVMIYEKTYAGSWSGGGKAGLLSGLITNAAN